MDEGTRIKVESLQLQVLNQQNLAGHYKRRVDELAEELIAARKGWAPVQFVDDANGDTWPLARLPRAPQVGETVSMYDEARDVEDEFTVARVEHAFTVQRPADSYAAHVYLSIAGGGDARG